MRGWQGEHMNAAILAIGSELATGQVLDTNSSYLARRLVSRGITVSEQCLVGDHEAAISDAITGLSGRNDLLLVTGGLGPTKDDLTRQALAKAMGAKLMPDEDCLEHIRRLFRNRGKTMSDSNRLQALVPEGAKPLQNLNGTAPGLEAYINQCSVFVMPGVPSEMKTMFDEQVVARLPEGTGVIVHKTLHTFGLGESALGEMIADLMARDANPMVGTTASGGMVSVRISARAHCSDKARELCERLVAKLKHRLAELVVGVDQQTMPVAVGRLLADSQKTLAVAESCTGGMIGKMVTDVPGSSEYFLGGILAYANDVKRSALGVAESLLAQHGAVSEPVAVAMAEGARKLTGSDYALSVTGIAGPDGGTQEKPVGLVYTALAGPDGTRVTRSVHGGDRHMIRTRAALSALNLLRLKLLHKD